MEKNDFEIEKKNTQLFGLSDFSATGDSGSVLTPQFAMTQVNL